MSILDLGGSPRAWVTSGVTPKRVVTVNLEAFDEVPGVHHVVGDACRPPKEVREAKFDLVFSNSLLEHVGGLERRLRVVDVINEAADRHWVQTPYRYFPVEPHWVMPGMQFLPLASRAVAARYWRLGYMRSTQESALDDVLWVELLSRTEMRRLFPDSEIWTERFAGLPKSLVAIRC